MKVLVVLLAVICSFVAANPAKNGLADLLAAQGGLIELGPRIVGGVVTPINQVPYIASMQRFGGHRCGTVIVTACFVLTAAHCLHDIPPSQIQVRAGSQASNGGGQLIQVVTITDHPQYSRITLNNDISVMRLGSSLNLALPSISTIGLPAQGAGTAAGTLARVAGWGATSEGGSGSILLQTVEVPVVTNAVCNTAYGGGISNNMICAGFTAGGRDACQGDSGGPLTAGNQVIGIVSWGRGCARPNFFGVYARVASFRTWIDSLTNNQC